jgi:hypothetical protein
MKLGSYERTVMTEMKHTEDIAETVLEDVQWYNKYVLPENFRQARLIEGLRARNMELMLQARNGARTPAAERAPVELHNTRVAADVAEVANKARERMARKILAIAKPAATHKEYLLPHERLDKIIEYAEGFLVSDELDEEQPESSKGLIQTAKDWWRKDKKKDELTVREPVRGKATGPLRAGMHQANADEGGQRCTAITPSGIKCGMLAKDHDESWCTCKTFTPPPVARWEEGME